MIGANLCSGGSSHYQGISGNGPQIVCWNSGSPYTYVDFSTWYPYALNIELQNGVLSSNTCDSNLYDTSNYACPTGVNKLCNNIVLPNSGYQDTYEYTVNCTSQSSASFVCE
jgi:hypothetical protein